MALKDRLWAYPQLQKVLDRASDSVGNSGSLEEPLEPVAWPFESTGLIDTTSKLQSHVPRYQVCRLEDGVFERGSWTSTAHDLR